MGSVTGLGQREAAFVPDDEADPAAASRLAEVLAEHDDAVLARLPRRPGGAPGGWLRRKLAGQVRDTLVHPVFFGSAITGAGVDDLLHGLAWLLPAAAGDAGGPLSGRVFKVDRGAAGDKVAYARMFSGTIAVRDRVLRPGRRRRRGTRRRGEGDGKVTAISVFADGAAQRRDAVTAGQIARLSGLADIQVGDVIGTAPGGAGGHHFAPPTLETAVVARDPRDKARLHAAMTQLAEQDPLINVRQDDSTARRSTSRCTARCRSR